MHPSKNDCDCCDCRASMGLDGKGTARSVGEPGQIPEPGRILGEKNGNSLRYSWSEEPGGLQSIRSQRVGQN